MLKRKRTRRDAAENIYRNCKQWGTCPEDVINKIEQKTPADKILQYGSLGVFLGGLGIGTGKGTGGTTGYVPLGEGPGVRIGGRPLNRTPFVTVPLDPIGARDFMPVNVIEPLAPSVIPLEDLPPAIDLPGSNFEVVAEVHPASDIPPVRTPGATKDSDALIELSSHTPPVRTVTRTQYNNPLFEIRVTTNNNVGETSASDHIFSTGGGGSVVGETVTNALGEEIPLITFRGPDFEESLVQETDFTTSTPKSSEPITYKPMTLNKRIAENIEVPEREFLGRPRKLVTFDNPVFEEDPVSLVFEQDVQDIVDEPRAAPHPEFRDVVRLGRLTFSQQEGGRVRASRIGKKAIMKTRSGTVIGPKVHFYQDISSIAPGESIEMVTLGEHSGDTSIVSPLNEGVTETEFEQPSIIIDDPPAVLDLEAEEYPEETLIDSFDTDVGERLHLLIRPQGRQQFQIPVPVLDFDSPVKVVPDLDSVIIWRPDTSTIVPHVNPDGGPLVIIVWDTTGPDFSLHPSLLRKRRKKNF